MIVHDLAGFRLHAPATVAQPRGGFDRTAGSRRLPYWSRPWPSGVTLARLVAGELADRVRGKRVIELGCGLGISGMSAARVGADVTLTDGEDDAVQLAAENAVRNELVLTTRTLEFDRVPEELVGAFDVVLGADIVYDREKVTPLAGAIHTLLVPGGEAWIAEPHRLGPTILLASAASSGLEATLVKTLPHPDGMFTHDSEEVMDIHIYRLVRPA